MPSKTSLAALVVAIFVSGAATAPSASAAPPDDACSLLTQAQVSTVLGVSVGAGSYEIPTSKKVCAWTVAGSPEHVTLMLESLDAYQAGKAAPTTTIVVTSVSGIGDDAYYLVVGNNVGLILKKGNVAFKVAVYAAAPIDKKEALEKTLALQIVSKL